MAFEEGAAIRLGERDDDIPDFDVITGWFQRVPLTWLPGLFMRVATVCVIRGVFAPGGIEKTLERAKQIGGDPTSMLRES